MLTTDNKVAASPVSPRSEVERDTSAVCSQAASLAEAAFDAAADAVSTRSAHRADAASRDHIGAKAATLADLRDAGFRVPDFVVSPRDLDAAIQRLGFPLAVRSSAAVEDGAVSSFAGQFRSFLNLSSSTEVEEAVRRCRESARSSAVAACAYETVSTQLPSPCKSSFSGWFSQNWPASRSRLILSPGPTAL
jgi:formate-dependent phosphoribosylglycinamide formyltransferase (GAR transformylase)